MGTTMPKPDNYVHEPSITIFGRVSEEILARDGVVHYPTGLKALDSMIWGVHPKQLLVVAARPSHGKSALVQNIALSLAAKKIPTILLSLEMSRDAVIERFCCIQFNLHNWHLRQGHEIEKVRFRQIEHKMNRFLIDSPIEVIDSLGHSIHEVEQVLDEFKDTKVLLIDHVQKITNRGYSNKYEALSDYVNTLQSLAMKYNVAIVLASQISRKGQQESNVMENLKGSGDIEEAADTLISCHWLCRDSQSDNPHEYKIVVHKQRNGPTGDVFVDYNAPNYKFSDRQDMPPIVPKRAGEYVDKSQDKTPW